MDAVDLIYLLQKNGWRSFQGECSVQASIVLKTGETLRIGITDDDACERPGIWVDVLEKYYGDINFDDGRGKKTDPPVYCQSNALGICNQCNGTVPVLAHGIRPDDEDDEEEA